MQNGPDLSVEVEGPWLENDLLGSAAALADQRDLFQRRFTVTRLGATPPHQSRPLQTSRRQLGRLWHPASIQLRRPKSSLRAPQTLRAQFPRARAICHFAHKHGLTPSGTFAHELPMALQAMFGVRMCNRAALDAWVDHYRGDLGIALTDTVTTEVFLRDFDSFYAKLFDGVRIDSATRARSATNSSPTMKSSASTRRPRSSSSATR